MRAYIQTDKNGDFYNVNAFIANEGFSMLGWETIKFFDLQEIEEDKSPESLLVGGIGNVRKRLEHLGLKRKHGEIDYPNTLAGYLGRKVWSTTIQKLFQDKESWNVFVKPKDMTKKFAGKVVKEYSDFIGLVEENEDTSIWCSEIIDFKTEWRCFIRYGEIVDIRRYKGAWDSTLDTRVIERAVSDFTNAPAAYGMDFGVDHEGNMKLVEINDGHSLGSYGISSVNYAKFLSARWAEMTGTTDDLRFL
ncbi:ATP-grasp domain-containing protein [Paenibacillus xylanilyticus]|uniref:ATP-grasp domain-containing protein n=1 Tax=Paenibacillus xylanilyticus TaxID=248903 RepID=A0A7Y6C399_9BACL|nr:ATP-grasp domain-containing protein [Paenibacillus xylanilyticus]NUU79784.1 ATP-grasp domain-containing protein [Paenibacillus xylanilyticus]